MAGKHRLVVEPEDGLFSWAIYSPENKTVASGLASSEAGAKTKAFKDYAEYEAITKKAKAHADWLASKGNK